ncbi:DUF2169 family type VI secretion system accessory protein [Candidatus Nitrospira salsa]
MQITSNTTGMEAGLTMFTDKDGRDHCVVVVKGTFIVEKDGTAVLAEEQTPLIYADDHYGDPGTTAIKYECDFAPFKSRTDVLLNGHAYSPTGKPIRKMTVALEVGKVKKEVRVIGDRQWRRRLFRLRPSTSTPFLKMPLSFDRAFGGSDHTHDNPKKQGTEMRNPVGRGFHKNAASKTIRDTPLPNLEDPRSLIRKWSHAPAPAGFGPVGRGWQPRIQFAGTYDDQWLKDRFPFLPNNFDYQYFQSAPTDQQFPHFSGGEVIRCSGMTSQGSWMFIVPIVKVPIMYKFRNREVQEKPKLDTLIIEPDVGRVMVTWRTMVPLGRKIHALREVIIGKPSTPVPPKRTQSGKLHFKSINDLVAWNKGDWASEQ